LPKILLNTKLVGVAGCLGCTLNIEISNIFTGILF